MVIDPKIIDEKVKAGKPLTKEEAKEIMSEPNPAELSNKPETEIEEDLTVKVEEEEPAAKVETPPAVEDKPKEEKKPVIEVEDFFVRLERELAKPDGKEELKDFSPREKAYFRQMRLDRKSRQKAEEERDALAFEKIKAQREKESVVTPPAKEPEDFLKGKDPDDFLTVKEARLLQEQLRAQKQELVKEAPPVQNQTQRMLSKAEARYLQLCETEARVKHEDFDEVVELSNEILNSSDDYKIKILKAMQDGENPAEAAYEIIKSDTQFSTLLPMAQARIAARKPKPETKPEEPADKGKEEAAQRAEEELAKPKTKTTGHVSTGDDSGGDELPSEDITRMSVNDFRKLPKKKREQYLKLYG
jgi:hypothetical protein